MRVVIVSLRAGTQPKRLRLAFAVFSILWQGMYEIRHIAIDTAALLSQLSCHTYHDAYSDLHSEANLAAYCADNFTQDAAEAILSDPNIICKIAFKDGVAAGFYIIKDYACPVTLRAPSAELKQIYTLADHYGTGLGRALFNDATATILNMGKQAVWLTVADANHRAKAFYGKLGFEVMGGGPVFHVGTDRLSSTVLALNLT